MSKPLDQHQVEIQQNLQAWKRKPLLREIYRSFYERIIANFSLDAPGAVVEIGSGIGNLKEHYPPALATDLFPNPWLDLTCDGYDLPFRDGTLSHLILFDVFHHLEAPAAFLKEAQRVLVAKGRLIVFDPYISLTSFPVYGLLHHEPVAWTEPVRFQEDFPRPRKYYAAQGNATRLFFRKDVAPADWLQSWQIVRAEAFSAFAYFLSGGFSKPALYPEFFLPWLRKTDQLLSQLPRLFGGRCLVVVQKQ